MLESYSAWQITYSDQMVSMTFLELPWITCGGVSCTFSPHPLLTLWLFGAVQPVAVRSSIDVFGENKRLVVEIGSAEFGSVVYVIIAAVQVGSITMTTKEGQQVTKVCSS